MRGKKELAFIALGIVVLLALAWRTVRPLVWDSVNIAASTEHGSVNSTPFGRIVSNNGVAQSIILSRDYTISKLSLRLATYGSETPRTNTNTLQVAVNGVVVAETSFSGTSVKDNSYKSFHFSEDVQCKKGDELTIMLTSDGESEGAITIYMLDSHSIIAGGVKAYRVTDGVRQTIDGQMNIMLYAKDAPVRLAYLGATGFGLAFFMITMVALLTFALLVISVLSNVKTTEEDVSDEAVDLNTLP